MNLSTPIPIKASQQLGAEARKNSVQVTHVSGRELPTGVITMSSRVYSSRKGQSGGCARNGAQEAGHGTLPCPAAACLRG